MEYQIATEAQLPQLAQMRWDFRLEGGGEVPLTSRAEFVEFCTTFFRHGLVTGDWTYWIAQDNREVVSHIFIHTIRSMPRPHKLRDQWGYITNVYTKPAYRNQGLGAALLQYVRQWATAQDLELLLVSPSAESLTFYQRAGFMAETDFIQLRLRDY